jgi:hypothetical protein
MRRDPAHTQPFAGGSAGPRMFQQIGAGQKASIAGSRCGEKRQWFHELGHPSPSSGRVAGRQAGRVGRCFIVDFVCLKQKLVVEVDGGQHSMITLRGIERRL